MMLAMTFTNAGVLWLLLLIPVLVVAYVIAQRRRPKYAARFTNLDLLATVVARRPNWRRHLPPVIYLLALATLLFAIGRPTIVTADSTQQATVMLVIDVSGSMIATDVQPTRLAAAQRSAQSFIDEVPKELRLGLVAFSSEARLLAPPTTDRQLVRNALSSLTPVGATAMGDAIVVAVDASLASSSGSSSTPTTRPGPTVQPTLPSTTTPGKSGTKPTPTVLLLLSDGKNTVGSDPLTAAASAKQLGVQISTIALGTPNGVASIPDSTGQVQDIPVPPDPDTLKAVAEQTGGRFFTAPTAEDLTSVYKDLGSKLGTEKHRHEVTAWFAGAAVILLLLGGGLALLWFSRFP
jgi:Ca-activated chloride channel family protein